MTCVFICLYETPFIIESTSGQVYYKVYKVDELKLFKSTSDEFVIKSTSEKINTKFTKWTSSSHEDALKLFKSTSGQVHYQVHRWARSIQSPQSGRVHPMRMP